MVRLFNGVEILKDGMAGVPEMRIRVLGTWGAWAGLPCGCVTTAVFIAINSDGFDMSLYQVGPLLDPTVDSLVTEAQEPTLYISYGLRHERRNIRVVATLGDISITRNVSRQ